MELKKNDIVELEITGLTAEGSGVGRAGGVAVFVPASAEGDRLRVRILKTAKNHAYGKIEEILSPSRRRVQADCGCFLQCGGCVFRHIGYQAELEAKQRRVRDAMERIGGFRDFTMRPIIGAACPNRYRNKAQYPFGPDKAGRPVLGLYASHSHRIVPCEDCLLQPEAFVPAARAVKRWAEETNQTVYDETAGKGLLRHLYLRYGAATGQVMVCLVVNGLKIPGEEALVRSLTDAVPGLKSVVVNSNLEKTNVVLGKKCRTLWGSGSITDRLCGLDFEISPLSFYQVNRDQAERLYGLAAQYAALEKGQVLLDLYCGTGTIGLSMAKDAGQVVGVEVVEPAVKDAERNARRNGISNAEFLCMDAAQAAGVLKQRGLRPLAVVLDPPRKGCAPELIGTVAEMAPERVVYVSCDPATLARDARLFAQHGFLLGELTPVDMFPRTAHVETVCLLSKANAGHPIEVGGTPLL